MSWFDADRNRGLKPAVIGYSAIARSYATSHEQHVQYGGFSARPMELFKNIPGAGDNPLLRPAWGPTHHDQPKKGDHKARVHRDNSPPSRDHHHGKYKNFSSDECDDDDSESDVICENGICYPKPKHMKEEDYEKEKPKVYPHSAPKQEKPKGNGYNPSSYSVPVSTHPRRNPYRETSFNPQDTYNEKLKRNTYDSNERPKGSTYDHNEKPKGSTYDQNERPKGSTYDHNEKPKGSSYGPPSYTLPVPTHPKRDPYHETSHNPQDTYNEKPKGSTYDPNERPKGSTHDPHLYNERPKGSTYDYSEKPKDSTYSHPSYTGHISTHLKKDPYRETSYNPRETYNEKPKGSTYDPNERPKSSTYGPPSNTTQPSPDIYPETSTNRPMVYDGTSPHPQNITTVKGADRSGFTSSPRKEHETIDSKEARRRYGDVASGPPAAQQNRGTIDSEEAAKKYNGIFVKMK